MSFLYNPHFFVSPCLCIGAIIPVVTNKQNYIAHQEHSKSPNKNEECRKRQGIKRKISKPLSIHGSSSDESEHPSPNEETDDAIMIHGSSSEDDDVFGAYNPYETERTVILVHKEARFYNPSQGESYLVAEVIVH